MTDQTIETGTSLIQPENLDLTALFESGEPAELEKVIGAIEKRCQSEVFDMTDEKSREACRSLAYQITRSKTTLEAAGKKLSDELRAKIAPINVLRKMVESRFDALRDTVRAPFTEWEADEKDRVEKINGVIESLRSIIDTIPGSSVQVCEERLERVKNIPADEDTFAEFLEIGAPLHADAIRAIEAALDAAKVRDAEAAELAEFRKQKEEAKRIADGIEQAAAIAAQKERDEAARKEREAEVARQAVEQERQRQEREAEVEAEAAARKAARKAHRTKVRREAAHDLKGLSAVDGGLDIEQAEAVIAWIEEGKVRHVSINF